MRPIDFLGGPTRSVEQVGLAYRLTVTPPAWSGFTASAMVTLSPDQYRRYQEWMNTGTLIQNALPDLSDTEREVILTGLGPQAWAELADTDEE